MGDNTKIDIGWIVPAFLAGLLFAAILVLCPFIASKKSAHIIIRTPKGDVIEGKGKITRFSDSCATVEIDGVKYTVSYQNVMTIEE